jgi:predicted nucleic acid-binding protein
VTERVALGIIYLDTSALVKRYVSEPGSHWLNTMSDPKAGRTIATALVTWAEAAAAFARKYREGHLLSTDYAGILKDLAHDFVHEYVIVEVDQVLVQLAVDLTMRRKLRGYDAVQLAAALMLNEMLINDRFTPLTFIAADDDLLEAARDEGLLVDDTNDHL